MKKLVLILCAVGVFALAGCGGDGGDGGFDGGNGNGGDDGAVTNLRDFVLANCNEAPSGDPVPINGASFPEPEVTDPANSVYTRECLGG